MLVRVVPDVREYHTGDAEIEDGRRAGILKLMRDERGIPEAFPTDGRLLLSVTGPMLRAGFDAAVERPAR
jgi:hypothetical protein